MLQRGAEIADMPPASRILRRARCNSGNDIYRMSPGCRELLLPPGAGNLKLSRVAGPLLLLDSLFNRGYAMTVEELKIRSSYPNFDCTGGIQAKSSSQRGDPASGRSS